MLINEMREEECRAALGRASMGRLACALDHQPYVVPVSLAYDSDYVYIFSTFGKKVEWMRTNPSVCIEIEELTNQTQWATVIANGRYQELAGPQYEMERAHARQLLEKRNQWWLNVLAERLLKSSGELVAPLYFRIHIVSMTGLRAGPEDDEVSVATPHG
jgi:uncharacterized protein